MMRAPGVSLAWIVVAAIGGVLARHGAEAQNHSQPEMKRPVWTLGVYSGDSPLQLRPAAGASNPILRASDVTDMNVDAVAHPFLARRNGRFYLFFTAKDLKSDQGGIGLAESSDGITWKFRQTVIRESFVQSHPFVFEWHNEYYLIPEAHTEKSVRLYRATAFPDRWQYERNLLAGDDYISPTLVRYQDLWWLFTSPSGNQTLRLFYTRDFNGPWKEHPMSPVVKNDLKTARPAGRPFVIDGTLYRLGQDCYPTYGRAVHAFRITEISPTAYAEKMVDTPVVEASGKGWNSNAMHHVDALRSANGRWIAVVDALGLP